MTFSDLKPGGIVYLISSSGKVFHKYIAEVKFLGHRTFVKSESGFSYIYPSSESSAYSQPIHCADPQVVIEKLQEIRNTHLESALRCYQEIEKFLEL